jgi:hypothetical protein
MKIESEFMHRNLDCKVVFHPLGFRCGYVGVPKTHKLYNLACSDEVPVGATTKYIYEILEVHGGITYAGSMFDDANWYFGFDCDHVFDTKDLDKSLEYGLMDSKTYRFHKCLESRYTKGSVHRSLEYCIGQCSSLADQLARIEGGKE